MTLIVNLFAGPGTGKSTAAAGIFHGLKLKHINCEYVSEKAKDLCWEERHTALSCQPYILGEQYLRIFRLLNKVDVIVTDSPLLLNIYYNNLQLPELDALTLALHSKLNNKNYFLKRTKPYFQAGRLQSFNEAKTADVGIKSILDIYHVPYQELLSDDTIPDIIIGDVLNAIK